MRIFPALVIKRIWYLAAALPGLLAAQDYPKDLRSPVDSTLSLSGNFGELRNNHYHSGFDIRTGNKEGSKIYSVAEGYVSRIRVSPFGYGKALYITHPNGYVSVYGHLKEFNGTIGTYVRKKQYEKESFDVDLLLTAAELPVKKGELIALSGNTGSSSGPHLHFEMRDAATEEVINPLHFGFKVPDKVPPILSTLAIYPAAASSKVNGKNAALFIPLIKKGDGWAFKTGQAISVSGPVYFGIECHDKENASSGKNGVYAMQLSVDTQVVYSFRLDRFAFSETRYANRHIDYSEKKKSERNVQLSHTGSCNLPKAYKASTGKGIAELSSDKNYTITWQASDFAGNSSKLSFKVKGTAIKKETSPVEGKLSRALVEEGNFIKCGEARTISKAHVQVSFPANCLYDDAVFDLRTGDTLPRSLCPVYHIMSDSIPLHVACTLSIKANVPETLTTKALIVSLDKKNRRYPETSEYKDGWLTAQVKSLGSFTVATDTTAPVIKPVNIANGKKITGQKTISLKATDNLSGIKTYRATIDGKWVLMEYEPKKNLFFHTFNEVLSGDTHTFVFEVTDAKANKSTFTATFSN